MTTLLLSDFSNYHSGRRRPSSSSLSLRQRKKQQPLDHHHHVQHETLDNDNLDDVTEDDDEDDEDEDDYHPAHNPTRQACHNHGRRNNSQNQPSLTYSAFRSCFWTLIIMTSVVAGGFFLHNNTSEFLHSTVQTTLDGSVPLSEVFFPSVVVCNINQIRKSFFDELEFYENDTLVRIMYEDFIKGTKEAEVRDTFNQDPKRDAFYEVSSI